MWDDGYVNYRHFTMYIKTSFCISEIYIIFVKYTSIKLKKIKNWILKNIFLKSQFMLGVSGIQDVVEQVPEKMAYKAVKQ